ncbi:MAG: DUF433 domain-containing protein [Isosphaeraceae bacterium]
MSDHAIKVPDSARGISTEGWLAERAEHAALTLQHCVEVNPNKCSGVPVFRGTRFTLARFLAELAEERSVTDIARDFDLDEEILNQFLRGLSICLDRPLGK